jgi:hypothetical protein
MKDETMQTNYLFKDLYEERWGDPANPNAADPPASDGRGCAGSRGLVGRLAGLFRRRRNRPSAWSFTIPGKTADAEDEADIRHRASHGDPKFLALARALSRNC